MLRHFIAVIFGLGDGLRHTVMTRPYTPKELASLIWWCRKFDLHKVADELIAGLPKVYASALNGKSETIGKFLKG